jgi:hypothetical protein
MPDSDSIDFMAKYKEWNISSSMPATDSTATKDIAAFLAYVREETELKSFTVLGIDMHILDTYAARITRPEQKGNHSGIIEIYKQLGSPDSAEAIMKSVNSKEELAPFAKAYLLRSCLDRTGTLFYLQKNSRALAGNTLSRTIKQGKAQFEGEGISFMAKYKSWVSIKKMGIYDNTKPEEISAHLTQIRNAVDRKSFAILGVNVDRLDSYAAQVTGSMRKSLANLQKIIEAASAAQAAKEIEESCMGNAALKEAAQAYLFSSMFRNLKVDYYVNTDVLMDVFPGLKIPKPKGRMPGQKKKKQ